MDDTQPASQPVDSGRYKTLSNGAVYDRERGRIAKGPPAGSPHSITTENARDYHKLRAEKYARATAEGLKLATNTPTRYAGWEQVTANLTRMALGDGRTAVEATKVLGQALGAMPDRRNTSDNVTNNLNVVVNGNQLARLLGALGGDTVDGELVDRE